MCQGSMNDYIWEAVGNRVQIICLREKLFTFDKGYLQFFMNKKVTIKIYS